MPRHVPGHRMPQIEPLHADGTVCTHPTAPSGKPRDPDSGCTGRANYRATCECGWSGTQPIRESLKSARDGHKGKAEAAAKETARRTADMAAATAQAAAVTVTYKRTVREVPCRLDWPTSRLLAEAVRAHGLRFAANTHLRLVHAGRVSPLPADAHTISRAGICNGDALDLRAPEPKKEVP